jgi:hypothetical protein
MSEKISDFFINIIKKTNAFKKINKIEFYLWSSIIITTFYGITSTIINQYIYYNYYNKNILNSSINEDNNLLEQKFGEHFYFVNKKMNNLELQLTALLENHQITTNSISKLYPLNISKKEEYTQTDYIYNYLIENSEITNEKEVEITNEKEVEITNEKEVEITNETEVEITNETEVEITDETEVEITNETDVEITDETEVEITDETEVEITDETDFEIIDETDFGYTYLMCE